MTILDNDRGYMRPVEEVARALVMDRTNYPLDDEQWRAEVARHREMVVQYPRYAGARSLMTDAFRDAEAALNKLRELGFINDIGLAAIKAEAKQQEDMRK